MRNQLNMCKPYNIPEVQKSNAFMTSNFSPLIFHSTDNFHKIQKEQEKNINNCNHLEATFLSKKNQSLIQKLLFEAVYNKSGYKIPYQKRENVLIVMKYIFNFYSQNLNNSIKQQIYILNNLVIDEVTSQIINNINSHMKYLRDSQNQPKLLDLPKNSNTSNITLPSYLN
tara:strand:+ start:1144 stop:1653 length:510 start_codon:yes stop_codon:yes gene_type:complete